MLTRLLHSKFIGACSMLFMSVLFTAGISQAFVMNGNVLKVGIDNSGGLVDLGAGQGITYKPGPANDYTLPGTPWEFYSIGVNGAVLVGGVAPAAVNPIGMNTVNNSAGNQFKADSTGPAFALGGALLSYDQSVAFDTNSNVIKFKADIFNVGSATAINVVYARGFDPDQDVISGAGFATINTFLGPSSVISVGPQTGLSGRIDGVGGIVSISNSAPAFPWETNPYILLAGGLVNGAIPGNPFDYSINIAWNIGNIESGKSVELDWTYTFAPVPLPPSVFLLASGLVGFVLLRRRAG